MWMLLQVIAGDYACGISVFIKHKDLKKEHTESQTGIVDDGSERMAFESRSASIHGN